MKTERTLSLADAIGKLRQACDGHRFGASYERRWRRVRGVDSAGKALSRQREREHRTAAGTLDYAIHVLRQVRR